MLLLIPSKLNKKIMSETGNNGIKIVDMIVPLKYLSNLWRTLKMPLINCQIYLILTWFTSCVIVFTDVANQGASFSITETCFTNNFIT